MGEKIVRIGGASGFWGDASSATAQLLGDGRLDFIVYDYLAEITMSIMARARAKDPDMGFAGDFVATVLKPNLAEISDQGVKLISNAGGVNPDACAAAARAAIEASGLSLKVAVVRGDDLLGEKEKLAASGLTEMFSGEPFPDAGKVASVNAYLGAFPIAAALAQGADIVITGRCVDSAVTLGACIYSFGWRRVDLDLLAAGSLAGHILECGPQATGGNFTDWELVAEMIHEIGYPIAEVGADGSFTVTKPDGTGGLVSIGTVAEQMLYEIGDPQAYLLPDVACDFSDVTLEEAGKDRVRVSGAKGHGVPDTYKVCATWGDGFRGGTIWSFYGIDADRKAEAFANAAFARARTGLRSRNLADFRETSIEVIGAESHYGAAREIDGSREVAVKIAAKHDEASGISILLREMTALALATPPGLSSFAGARPKPSPILRLYSFLTPKDTIEISAEVDGEEIALTPEAAGGFDRFEIERQVPPEIVSSNGELVKVPLIALAWGRSGDKGDKANIGIIARRSEYLPYIWASLTEAAVASRFAHFLETEDAASVERFHLPGANAINFLLHNVLGGGGVASLRNDPQGKGYAQLLLDHPIAVPSDMAEAL